jgi:hypothetical protein
MFNKEQLNRIEGELTKTWHALESIVKRLDILCPLDSAERHHLEMQVHHKIGLLQAQIIALIEAGAKGRKALMDKLDILHIQMGNIHEEVAEIRGLTIKVPKEKKPRKKRKTKELSE